MRCVMRRRAVSFCNLISQSQSKLAYSRSRRQRNENWYSQHIKPPTQTTPRTQRVSSTTERSREFSIKLSHNLQFVRVDDSQDTRRRYFSGDDSFGDFVRHSDETFGLVPLHIGRFVSPEKRRREGGEGRKRKTDVSDLGGDHFDESTSRIIVISRMNFISQIAQPLRANIQQQS